MGDRIVIKAKPMENSTRLQTRRSHNGGEEKRCWNTGGARAYGVVPSGSCGVSLAIRVLLVFQRRH